MTGPLQIDFPDGAAAVAVEVTDVEDLPSAVGILGLQPPRPTVVVVGGAGGLDEADIDRLRPIFSSGIVPELERHRAAVVDGGTLAGVMRLCGETRASLAASFPLVGVVAAGTVQLPGRPAPPDGAALEPHHSHFLIVPGDNGVRRRRGSLTRRRFSPERRRRSPCSSTAVRSPTTMLNAACKPDGGSLSSPVPDGPPMRSRAP